MTSGMERVRSRYVRMMSRFLVLSALVVFRCFTMVTSSVGHMFLGFLVVLGSFLGHWDFLRYGFWNFRNDLPVYQFNYIGAVRPGCPDIR
jgi:hypothetical protein